MKISYKDILIEGFKTLSVNKLRTGLAILGIVIGIGSVIALISLGESSTKSIQSQIESLGANLLTIQPGSTNSGNVRSAAGSASTLANNDADSLKNLSTIKAVSPELSSREQVSTGQANTNTQVYGVTPAYQTVRNLKVLSGVFISDTNVNNISKVAVIGPTVSSDLFGDNVDPVGKTVKINGMSFTVVGVTESKGGSGFSNQDDIIFIPLSTAQKQVFGKNYLSSIALEVTDKDLMVNAQNDVGYQLLSNHKISDPTNADFTIMSQQDILNSASQMTSTLTTMLGGIGAISLLVGGIGIMNIMLVTVTERTREIGLRKALGATKKIVITQFLAEAIILTIIGGLIGILAGIVAFYIITLITSTTFTILLNSIILAFGVSAAIGIVFGWYPAKKASNLQPIEALRYE